MKILLTYQTLQCPNNAHNVKNVELLKHFKITEAARTCFGLQGNHHQGANCQYLAKITHLVQCGYIEVVHKLSVLWLHSMTCDACVLYSHIEPSV
jgi:lipid A disaccharide synthetase